MKRRSLVVLISLLVVLAVLLPSGIFLLDRYHQMDANFYATQTYVGDVPGGNFDPFIEIVDRFDYTTELHLSPDIYNNKIANYCSALVFDHFATLVNQSKDAGWWKPLHSSYVRYQFQVDFLTSFNISCISYDSYPYDGISIVINPDVRLLNATHGEFRGSQDIFDDHHWYLNGSHLPDFFSHSIDQDEIVPIENLIQLADIHLISIDMRYETVTGVHSSSEKSLKQLVILSAALDVMAIFVYDWQHMLE